MPSPVFQYLIEDDSISEINSLFQVLFNYWDVCSKRHREYTFLQVEFITSDYTTTGKERNGTLKNEILFVQQWTFSVLV